MRISDGRSDVCSSDLVQGVKVTRPPAGLGSPCLYQSGSAVILRAMIGVFLPSVVKHSPTGPSASTNGTGRASCREECVSTCRTRWSPYDIKKHTVTVVAYLTTNSLRKINQQHT